MMSPLRPITFQKISIHQQSIGISFSPSKSSSPITDQVWGRKRGCLDGKANDFLPNEKKRKNGFESGIIISLEQEVVRMNSILDFCDDVLKMFDELVIPAARLLDTVETKLKDYNITHSSLNNMKQRVLSPKKEIIPKNYTRQQEKILFIPQQLQQQQLLPKQLTDRFSNTFNPFLKTKEIVSETQLHLPINQIKNEIEPLKEYTSIVYEENDIIDWSYHSHFKDQQAKQAEEEAETDDDMIEYGVKIASKSVRVAIRNVQSRDWSVRSRMEYYNQSIKRLQDANKHRGR